MEIRNSEEVRESIENFAKAYLEVLQEKKRIDEDIKVLKENFKEEGVPVGIVCKALNKIKAEKKRTDSERFEEETIQEWLQANTQIDDMLGILMAK